MTLIFDLDKTLYSSQNGLFKAIDTKINEYLIKFLNFKIDEVDKIRKEYWSKYGTTLNGLMKFHNVNPIHYLEYVHDVNLDDYLDKDETLINTFKSITCKKYIFTNGYIPFAKKVLEKLGIECYINDIFDIVWMEYHPKPYFFGYRKLINFLNINPECSFYFDDFYKNLYPAKYFKMKTVLVNDISINYDFIDYKIPDIKKIKNIIDF